MNIGVVLDQIDLGSIALPEFQRGYVWNREQVRGLMGSLYRRHPVGGLLVWVTKTEGANPRGEGPVSPGFVKLLLDGQQRITSLYGIIKGHAPAFFDGNAQSFTGLYFNMETEAFEFYAPIRMQKDDLWINVTDLMQKGPGSYMAKIFQTPEWENKRELYSQRINAISLIKDIDLHVEEVTGDDKDVDTVVEIFNKVNSGGTKLSKGDLALAKVCAQWPEARDEMKTRLRKWQNAGFNFKLDWLLRCINTIVTGEALFNALADVDTYTFQQGLQKAENAIDRLLDIISGRLGLDHDRVLGSRYSLPLLCRYLADRGGNLSDHRERDKILFWYINTFLWGRYAGSTESFLNQDLAAIEDPNGAVDRLIEQLRSNRGDLRLTSNDFNGWSRSARFYPLLYMMTRVEHAKDLDTGIELANHALGHLSTLQVHHIFPKNLLYRHGYSKSEVNAIANFTFLTQETNLKISNHDPAQYLEEFVTKQPGAVESHWIPMDRELWKVENYPQFLAARRQLLAEAANAFLDSLANGTQAEDGFTGSILDRSVDVLGSIASEEEEQLLIDANIWVAEQGLPEGEFGYQVASEETGELLALIDLAWPEGLQEGYSQPVALLLDEDQETEEVINRAGYLFFTKVESFKQYVRQEVLAVEEAAD